MLIMIFCLPTPVLSLPVGFFALFTLAIFSLCLPVAFSPGGHAAFVAAVGLASPAAPTDAENQTAPSALNCAQQQCGHASGLANTESM
jgi:hypothetical protein